MTFSFHVVKLMAKYCALWTNNIAATINSLELHC